MKPDITIVDSLIHCLDLTSLNGDETSDDIGRLCDLAREHGVAAVCCYPSWVRVASRQLEGSGIAVATVVNFPGGEYDIQAVLDSTVQAIDAGAREIDAVAPLSAIESGDIGLVTEFAQEIRAVATEHQIKMILETGRLCDPSVVAMAARAAIMGGVDFLKTSTGKIEIGATPEAIALLSEVIDEAGSKVGLKISGGVRTTAEAINYAKIVSDRLGNSFLRPERFRLGASSLINGLLASRNDLRVAK
ncbi:MAG: deoxyribose-phosphate aldolase [Pseudomonadota bacterium]